MSSNDEDENKSSPASPKVPSIQNLTINPKEKENNHSTTISQKMLQEILESIGLIKFYQKFKTIECFNIHALLTASKQQFLEVCSLVGFNPFETVRFQQALISYFNVEKVKEGTKPQQNSHVDIYDKILLDLYKNSPEHSKHDTETLCEKLLQAQTRNELTVPVVKFFQNIAEHKNTDNISEALISIIGEEFEKNEQLLGFKEILLNLVQRDEYLLLDRALLFKLCEIAILEIKSLKSSKKNQQHIRLKFSTTLLEQSEKCLRRDWRNEQF